MPDLSKGVEFTEYVLERRKYAARAMVDRGLVAAAESLGAEAYMDEVLHRMVIQMSVEVLAERVLDDEVTVPWSGTVMRTRPGQSTLRGWWLLPLLAVVGTAAALVAGFSHAAALATYLASCVVALAGLVLMAANPPRYPFNEELPVSGTVTVPATYWRTFPQATLRYPDSLGPYVKVQEIGNPNFQEGEDLYDER